MAKRKGSVHIAQNRCKGCGLCTIHCPEEILTLDSSEVNSKGYRPAAVTDSSACLGCGNCALICPDSVITVKRSLLSKGRIRNG